MLTAASVILNGGDNAQVFGCWLAAHYFWASPLWLRWALGLLIGGPILFFTISLLLHWLVKKRTVELQASEIRNRALIGSIPDLVFRLDRDGVFLDYQAAEVDLFNVSAEQLIGKNICEFVAPDLAETILCCVNRAIGDNEIQFNEFQWAVADQINNFEARYIFRDSNDVLVIVREMSERKRAELQSQRMLEKQIAINQLASSLGELKTLEEIYQIAYEHVIKLMDAESFIISFYDAKRQLIRAGFFIANGIKQDVSKFPPIPLEEEGRGTQSKVIRTGEPLTIPDFRAAMGNVVTEHTLAPDGEVFEGPPPEDQSEQSTNSALLVPFKDTGETVGVLQVQSYRLDAYAQGDVDLLAALANVISMAIQNARLYKETRQLADFSESIIANMTEGIVMEDSDGHITFVNPAAATLLGYAPDELLGAHWIVFVPPNQQPIIQSVDERRRQGESSRYEVELVRKDGERIFVLVSGSPLFDGDGSFVGTMAVFADNTEQKQTKDMLIQKNSFLAALQKTTLELLSQLDLDELLTNIVSRAGELMGTTSGYLDLLEPESGALQPRVGLVALAESLNYSVAPGEGIAGTVWVTGQPLVVSDYDCWDGRITEFSTNSISSIIGVPLLSGEKVIGVLGLAHEIGSKNTFGDEDVEYLTQFARLATLAIHNASLFTTAQQELSERNQVEQALRDSEERFRNAFFTSPDAININRLSDGLYVDVNEGFTAITGYAPDDVQGKTSAEIEIWVNPADRDTLVEGLKRDGQVNNLEARFRMKDGTQIFGLMSAKIIWLSGEAHILSVSRNIDVLKQAEAEILKRSQELSALNALSRRISQTLSKDEVISAAAADALAATHSNAAFLLLRNEDEFHLVEFQFSEPDRVHPEMPVDKASEYLCGLVTAEKQPVYLQSIASNPHNVCAEIKQLGLVSIALIPLFNEDGVFGILGLGSDYQRDYEQQSEYIEIMASTIAISLRNALLFEAESKRRLEAETLRRATALLTTSLDLKQVLENILDGLHVVVPYDSTSLFIFEAEGQRMVAGRGLPRVGQLVGRVYPLDDAFTPIVIETRRPLIIPDVSADPNFERWGEVAYIRGWMVIPLVVRDQVIGRLSLDSRTPNAYTQAHASAAQVFADQAAIAIDNARLFEQVNIHASELEDRVKERTEELRRMVNLMAGREVRMAELKKAIKRLRAQLQDAGMTPVANDPLLEELL